MWEHDFWCLGMIWGGRGEQALFSMIMKTCEWRPGSSRPGSSASCPTPARWPLKIPQELGETCSGSDS